MKIRCRHCGSLNSAEAVDATGAGMCTVCGRTLNGAPEGNGGQVAEGTFDPIDWSSDTFDLNAQKAGGVRAEMLGSLPTDDEALDISELLEGTSASMAPRPRDSHGKHQAEPTSRELLPSGSGAAWRIKNARGVVFEFQSVPDVSGWLSGQTDISSVRIARGAGPFRAVHEYQEFDAGRMVSGTDETGSVDESLDLSSGSDISDFLVDMNPGSIIENSMSSDAGSGYDGHLELDYHRASHRHGTGNTGSGVSSGLGGAEQMSAAVQDGRAFGFRSVLFTLVILFAVGHVLGAFLGLSDSITNRSELASSLEPSPPGPQLARAIQLLDDGNYTAATQTLQRLSKRTNDPQVFRFLASALYKTDRVQEAQVALEEYRRRVNTSKESK